ncbi:hypothetical protein RB195_025601 [Necator americanus]|uniref:EF-hand domain-containing protein n=1 Tax=Necator americanus TaxID=51031 RepID=A0ABR1ET82_NECAM
MLPMTSKKYIAPQIFERTFVTETVENALKQEMDDQKVHYKPESLDILVNETHFSRYELKYLYQSFKQEFAVQLSLFSKGTLEQRLDWLFDLYDCNGRGYITEEDHLIVCRAMYALVGIHYYKEKHFPVALKRHIKHQFSKLDKNRDGKITREEFIKACHDDNKIVSSMDALKTVW